MTKKSMGRLKRDRFQLPKAENIAGYHFDHEKKTVAIATKDILTNQIQREGPRIARSFDVLAQKDVADCSAVLARVNLILFRHLFKIEDKGFRATSSRILLSSIRTLTAATEVARHGYPSEFSVLIRQFIEIMATVLGLATNPDALGQFHAGELSSTKCITWSKKTLPLLEPLYRGLSNDFVHVGLHHNMIDLPKPYKKNDESIAYITDTLRTSFYLLDIITELVFWDEIESTSYWIEKDGGYLFSPSEEAQALIADI